MTTIRFVNKKADECIEQIRSDWSWNSFESRPCDENNNKQALTINADETIKTNGDTNWMTITKWRDLDFAGHNPDDVRASSDINGLSGSGRHGYFKFYNKNGDPSGSDIVTKAPFKIGSSYYTGQRLHFEDTGGINAETLRNYNVENSGEGNDRQLFLNYNLYKQCKSRGISFDNCTKDNLNNCSLPENNNIFEVCPKEYCLKSSNVSKKECRNWCDTNKGACDQTATEFCKSNPTDPFCNCFGEMPDSDYANKLKEKGIVLRRECNYSPCAIGNSYKTQTMISQVCSPITACITGIDIGSVGGSTEISNVQNSCTINETTSSNNNVNSPTPSSPSTQPIEESSQDYSSSEYPDTILGLPKTTFIILASVGGVLLFFMLLVILKA